MKKNPLFSLCIAILITLTHAARQFHYYEFNITSKDLNPDCYQQGYSVPLVNGQFPGPSIHVNQGDEVEILVRNLVQDRNTTIHYHGIRQIGTPEADGVPGVTQYPIYPNGTFRHKFTVVDQAGTYFYHAHVGFQDDSVKGAFIVYESEKANPALQRDKPLQAGPYTYKGDLILQLGEWWHEDLKSREDYYLGNQFQFDRGADSILINGRTVFNPEQEGLSAENCQGYSTFDVQPNTVYRLRIIGGATFRTLAIGIKDHNMTLIEIDGELTHPYNTSFLEVSPGQRYSALLHTGDHPPGTTFAIGTSYVWRQRGHGITENGFAYIRYTAPSKQIIKQPESTNLFKPIRKWEQHSLESRSLEPRAQNQASNLKIEAPRPRADVLDLSGAAAIVAAAAVVGPKKLRLKLTGESNIKTAEAQNARITEVSKIKDNEASKSKPVADITATLADVLDAKPTQVATTVEVLDAISTGAIPAVEAITTVEAPNTDSDVGNQGGRGGRRGGGQRGGGGGGDGQRGGGQRGGGRRPEKAYVDLPAFPNIDEPDWFYHNIRPLAPRNPILDHTNARTIKLSTSYHKMADNTTRYMVNNRVMVEASEPRLLTYATTKQFKRDVDSEYNPRLDTYPIKANETIDLVFQNTINERGGCLIHPWHTHGHSHYLIASGAGDYDHERDKDIRNFQFPIFRDTTLAYPSLDTNGTNGCGWTKVRLIADNPGFWAVHCHITTHMFQGKMIVLEEAPELIQKYQRYKK